MLFVCYPKCSTCQKAKAWLQERGVAFDERDIKQDNPTERSCVRGTKERLPLKRFFNTSGLQYKALGLKDKLPAMTEDEQYALLATDGMLVKRPLIIGEDFALPGFKVKNGRAAVTAVLLVKAVDKQEKFLYNKSCLSGKIRNGIEVVITEAVLKTVCPKGRVGSESHPFRQSRDCARRVRSRITPRTTQYLDMETYKLVKGSPAKGVGRKSAREFKSLSPP